MAKKLDRFGWERDRGTIAHDRIVTDWMDTLCDYPLCEVQEACKTWVRQSPRKMPNEGDIRGLILAARSAHVATLPKVPEPPREPRVSKEAADAIMERAGFSVKRFDGIAE